ARSCGNLDPDRGRSAKPSLKERPEARKLGGQPPFSATEAIEAWIAVSRSCSFSPAAPRGGRPSSVRALRTARQYARVACLRVVPAFERALDRAHPAHLLLQLLLGVPVRLVDRLGRFPQVVK